MKHQKQDKNQHDKLKHDYYEYPHVVRFMMYMIANQI